MVLHHPVPSSKRAVLVLHHQDPPNEKAVLVLHHQDRNGFRLMRGPQPVENIIAERLLTPNEVALLFRVKPKTVIRWAAKGRLTSVRTPGGRDRRFRESDVAALLTGAAVTA